MSEHQPALEEAKEISFPAWNLYFHGREAQVGLSQSFRMFLEL